MRKMKRVEDSRTENTYLIMNKHINSGLTRWQESWHTGMQGRS